MQVTSEIIDAALEYHKRGCWVTLCCEPTHAPGQCSIERKTPCHSPGKAPIHSAWQTERLTTEQIEHALTKLPTLNIGNRWGQESGMIDVEADTPEAERALQELLDECQFPELQLIPTYRSARGLHRLFQWTAGLPKAVVKLRGIEFRCGGQGKGAQSILPPSRHHTGINYQWLEQLSLFEVEPPELPPKLIELLRANGKPEGNGRVAADVLIGRAIERAPSGRNDAGLWLACQLRDNHYSEAEAEPAIRQYATAVAQGEHPYGEGEALATLRSAYSRSAREPWSSTASVNNNNKPVAAPPKFTLMSSPDFAASKYKLEWHAKPVLVKRQPAILGGAMKTLKTSFAVDLAVSLSTGTPFLGEFHVAEPCNVALLSGESGEAVLQETAKRICHARTRILSDCKIWWGFKLPQLARVGDLSALGDALHENAIDVLIVDPLYLCLLAGDSEGRSASNLFDMGPLLLSVAEMAAEVGCTPILLHHFKKTLADPYAPAELPDLAYSGVAEFARQWLLLSRRQEYEPGSGEHRLWLSVGGSAGHGGLWAIDANEGAIGEDFTGRKWELDVRPATVARADEKKERESERRQGSVDKVLATIGRYPQGESLSYLAQAASMSNGKFGDIAAELEKTGQVVRCDVPKPCGKGTRNVPGFRPKEPHPDTRTTPGQTSCPDVRSTPGQTLSLLGESLCVRGVT